jgi:hypothetical protein
MVFMAGEVEIVTKSKDILKGVLMPYEDVIGLSEHYPILELIGPFTKGDGVYIFTGKTLSYINRDEILTMKCLRFA